MGILDRNTELKQPEATTVEQELKRSRAFGWRDIIVCLAIVGVFLLAKDWLNENFGFTFGDSYDGLAPVLEETQFGITGLDGVTHTFVYAESDITLHDGLKDYLTGIGASDDDIAEHHRTGLHLHSLAFGLKGLTLAGGEAESLVAYVGEGYQLRF